jgi:hypothetical protein
MADFCRPRHSRPKAGGANELDGIRQQAGKLKNRYVTITLSSGNKIKNILNSIDEDSIVVAPTRATRQWTAGQQEARVPRDLVSSVQFSGKIARNGLIGGLVGSGGSAVAVGLRLANRDGGNCEAGGCFLEIMYIPLAGLAGYLIGHAKDKPAPTFIIEH